MLTNTELIGAIASAFCLILGSIFGILKWMISKFLSELRPNSGSSMKDQITRLEERIDDIYAILAKRSK
jgi:hypothetical protein